MSMFLTKEEVAELTGRKTKAKQIEHLRRIGMRFWVNALGNPVVPRSAIEGLPAIPTKAEPAAWEIALRTPGSHDDSGRWIPPGMREPNS